MFLMGTFGDIMCCIGRNQGYIVSS